MHFTSEMEVLVHNLLVNNVNIKLNRETKRKLVSNYECLLKKKKKNPMFKKEKKNV